MSKPKINKIYETDWVSLKRIEWPEKGINGYDFLHEHRCHGKIIAMLPFKYNNSGQREYLLRKEVTPCWKIDEFSINTITGGFEPEYGLSGTAKKELKEEAGYSVPKKSFMYFGTCRGTKSSDTEYHLFSIDLTDYDEGIATGDGSHLEENASCIWTQDITKSVDPTTYTIYVKLLKALS